MNFMLSIPKHQLRSIDTFTLTLVINWIKETLLDIGLRINGPKIECIDNSV